MFAYIRTRSHTAALVKFPDIRIYSIVFESTEFIAKINNEHVWLYTDRGPIPGLRLQLKPVIFPNSGPGSGKILMKLEVLQSKNLMKLGFARFHPIEKATI